MKRLVGLAVIIGAMATATGGSALAGSKCSCSGGGTTPVIPRPSPAFFATVDR